MRWRDGAGGRRERGDKEWTANELERTRKWKGVGGGRMRIQRVERGQVC